MSSGLNVGPKFHFIGEMKPLFALLLAVVFTLTVRADFQVGVAAEDVTPKIWPVHLIGSFSPRLAESANDPLMARAMVFSDGVTTVAICVVDNCLIDRALLDQAKEIVQKQVGIPIEKQLVSATHTHSAPPGRVGIDLTDEDAAYQKLLVEGIAAAITKANAGLQPASVGFGRGDLPDEVNNRRWFLKEGAMPVNPFGDPNDKVKMNPPRGPLLDKPAGPTDPEICVLSFHDAKDKPLGLLANYSLHYVGATPSGQVSGDYFGEFARLMKIRFTNENPNFLAAMSNGTSGDINNIRFANPRPRRETFEQIRTVAGKAADVVWKAHKDIEAHAGGDQVKVKMVERLLKLNRRKPTDEQVERAQEIVEMSEEDIKKLPRLAVNYAKRTLSFIERPGTYEVKLQAIRIGEDIAILSLPFETIVEIGLDLKKKSPFKNTFIIELANGETGYLPTPEQHKLGGYETWLTTNRVQKDASVIITKQFMEMLDELK